MWIIVSLLATCYLDKQTDNTESVCSLVSTFNKPINRKLLTSLASEIQLPPSVWTGGAWVHFFIPFMNIAGVRKLWPQVSAQINWTHHIRGPSRIFFRFCMVVIWFEKVGIGSDLPPLPPSLGQNSNFYRIFFWKLPLVMDDTNLWIWHIYPWAKLLVSVRANTGGEIQM